MNSRTWMTLGLLACLPGVMAPTAVNGSLAAFSQGTAGGNTPESWGVSPRASAARPSPQAPSPPATPQRSEGTGGPTEDSPKKQEPRLPAGGEGLPGAPAAYSGQGGQGGGSNQVEVPPNKQEPRPPMQGDASPGHAGGQGNAQGGQSGQSPAQGAQGDEPPKTCAEEGSACRQCVMSAQENIQFNRRYLHIAWSITHSHMVYAQRMIAIGDTASGLHQVTGLSWQLGAKMQIVGAVDQLRETYKRKYTDYMGNIRRSLQRLAQCEQDNFATQDLYRMYGSLYYDMLQVRYEKADP